MSSIPDLLARFSSRKLSQFSDVEMFLGDIDEIQKKTNEIFHMTAWPCIEQARKASWFGKTSALFIAKHYSTISSYYYSINHELDTALDYLNQAICGMRQYLDAPFDDKQQEFSYLFELSTAYLQWLQNYSKQSNQSQYLSEEALQKISDGLKTVDQALSLKESPELYLRKWNFLQLLDDSGNLPPEDPLVWSKKYLESLPDPSSNEYITHAQLRGGELARKGRLDEAEDLFKSLLPLREDPITYLCLGKVSVQKKQYETAQEYFQIAYDLDPNNIEIKLWFISEQTSHSIRILRKESRILSDDEIRSFIDISHQFCSTFSENAHLFIGKTVMFVPLKEIAEHLYMTQLPQIANVLTHLGHYPFAIGLYECILENVDRYLEANIFERSEAINLYIALGGLYALVGENRLGEKNLLSAIALDKENPMPYANLAGVYAAQEDQEKLTNLWNQLKPLYEHCIGDDRKKSFSTPFFNLGSAYTSLIKGLEDPAYIQSEIFYRLSLECNCDNWDARYSLARLLAISEDADRWNEARDLLTNLEKFVSSLPFGLSPLKGFSFYFCYSGILALCGDIPAAKKMSIQASKFHCSIDEIKVLQSYLDHQPGIVPFHREIRESIRKLQFNFPIGKWINPKPLAISEGSFIGYHGTIDTYLDQFKDGIQPRSAKIRQFRGKGFYTTESKEAASYFAMKKSKDEEGGNPVLLKIYSNSPSDLIGQQVNPKEKLRKEISTHYHFIQAPIDGLEAFSQHYFSENILEKLKIDSEREEVNWSEEEYATFIKQFKWNC